ncbi:ABC transporter permease [Massilia sp. WF1]|uniref:ABC transporter permease n=1 Tax=unclassified Massilia TaxID=2609279 RepID=UPI000649751E|nr:MULTISPECIES: FtsX-like permease family protein [unclassified Massilia]ALK98069.1 ABC transporter permease [Massilia sp. WG5]KLU35542.1 ABC transporter permease [Massilia sp. WF1]
MFRHLLKLTWQRKTRNFMLSLEIMLAFAVVFAIAAAAVRSVQLYRMPLGFDGDGLWSVELRPENGGKGRIDAATYDTFKRSVLGMPEVVHAAFVSIEPYALSTMSTTMKGPGDVRIRTDMVDASDGAAQALGLDLVDGRWFSTLDDGGATLPVVINRRLAHALFPGQAAVGRQFTDTDRDQKQAYKVVGVVGEYRGKGELMTPENFAFVRFAPGTGVDTGRDPRVLVLKLRSGTPRSFETRLNRRLKGVHNDWSYQITPLSAQRSSTLRARFAPLVIIATIAAFVLLMVAFGLFGTLWQNTHQRIPEIGLRRAVGARAADIYGQIVAEQLLLSTLAMVLGLVLLVQLPLTGALGETLNWTVFLGAAGLSMGVIYLLSLLCSLYPGWRASRLSPTEALHYE